MEDGRFLPNHNNSRKSILADVWCRRCGHASRFGQWVPTNDQCPHCSAPGSQRYPWVLLRVYYPALPLRPEIGRRYPLQTAK